MNSSLRVLMRQASERTTEQDEAILRLGMLLEFNRLAASLREQKREEYEAIVPADVLISLDESTEGAILAALGDLARHDSFKPSIIWAIGRAKASAAAPTLLTLVTEHSRLFQNPEAVWQGVAALENCYAPKIDSVRQIYAHEAIQAFLRSASESADERARDVAVHLLERMEGGSRDSSP